MARREGAQGEGRWPARARELSRGETGGTEVSPPAAPLRPALGLPRSWLAVALLLHVVPFATRPALIGGDEPHYALMAHSLAVDGDLELGDEYEKVAAGSVAAGRKRAGQRLDRHLRDVGGRLVPSHPAGLPALVAPLLAAQLALAPGAAPDLVLGLVGLALGFAALLAGCRLVGRWLGDSEAGAVAALAVYFTSPLWYYGRTFFTEPYTWSLAVLAIAAAVAGRWWLGSLLLGLTLVTKESALLLVVAILVGAVARAGARRAAVLAAGPATASALLVMTNLTRDLPLLFTSQPFQLGSPSSGARGLLFDPSRGLLWFAPLLVAGAIGWVVTRRGDASPQGRRTTARTAEVLVALATLGGYFLLAASWIDWRGGSGYGPRLLLPALPGLALPLAACLVAVGPRARLALAALGTCGFTLAWCAALDPVHAFWDAAAPDLLAARPVVTVAGVALGGVLAWRLLRRLPPRGGERPGATPRAAG
jgi:hypothetical protein